MPAKNFDWIEALKANPKEIFLDSTSTLITLMDNVISNPANPRYRSIRIGNPIVTRKLMSAVGAMECLFVIGFEEHEDRLTLPENVPLEHLIQIREEITARRNSYLNANTDVNQPTSPSVSGVTSGETSNRTEDGNPSSQSSESVQMSDSCDGSDQNSQNTTADNWAPVVTRVVGNLNALLRPQYRSRATRRNNRSTPSNRKSNVSSSEVSRVVSGLSGTGVHTPRSVLLHSQFLQSIRSHSFSVLRYEDKELQRKALALIPVKELEAAAETRMQNIRIALKKSSEDDHVIDVKELLLIELLAWFKNSFFSWVDAPYCSFCRGETTFAGMSTIPEELRETNRVEIYVCKQCNRRTLFPRYNEPGKLLETRKGRCGEWANCFTLFCRCLGWDARHVVDQTDHVWTEVYSIIQRRWLHCDPCENVCDQPLMYEKGWGKKLSYVIAYSYDDVQDVTWRYSCEHQTILSRRNLCTEEELLKTLWQVRRERQRSLSEIRRTYLTTRLLSELVEFLVPPKPSDVELQGRTSGSLAWRLARGETNRSSSITPYVWEPNSIESSSCSMQIMYSAAQDKYIRVSSNEEIKHWEKGVYEASSVFRKEEKDWNKAYLTRTEGTESGSIKWKFDCSKSGLVIDTVSICCVGTTFENGRIVLTLCNEEFCLPVPSGDSIFETGALKGSQSLILSAELSGGKGDVAWQHAQLFRQDLSSTTEYPFIILVQFKKV